MKLYKLNIDTSKPTNQVVQMQQNQRGLLSVNMTNNGKYIRNLSCTLYDGANEISATNGGFKVDVGAEPKSVKVVAKSEPMESIKEYIASYAPGNRTIAQYLKRIVIPAGTYRQDEFESLKQFGTYSGYPTILSQASGGEANFDRIILTLWNPNRQIWFGANGEWLSPDEPLIVNEEVAFGLTTAVRTSGKSTIVLSSETYPAIGYYTDYQMDTLIKPSTNAPYDGEYVEPLTAVEIDGVEYVPTTLSVDGVAYSVLAAVQNTEPETEPETEPTEG